MLSFDGFWCLFSTSQVLHSYLGPLGRAISGPAAGLALRYAQQLSGAMEGHLGNVFEAFLLGFIHFQRVSLMF